MTQSERNDTPELAVIMSVYHRDNPVYLHEALQSILLQSISHTHQIKIYLMIDGPVGSDIDAVIFEFRDRIFRIFRQKVNYGLAAALNILIANLADEPFVFRMDADDIALPDRFKDQLSYLEQHGDVDILGGAIIEFGGAIHGADIVRYPASNSAARRQIAFRSPVAHPSVCFRRTAFSKVGAYPEIHGNEDIALWFEFMKQGLVFANLPQPILKFRVSAGFWARRGFRKSLLELQCYLKGLNAIEGPSYRMLFPILRFCFRLMPEFIRKMGYNLRRKEQR